MDLLRVASEHFLRTLALKEKFDQVSLVGAALDQLSHGLAICDATARVLFANAAAREVIDAEDRLRLRQGQLCSDSPALTAKLHSMIVTAARREGVAGRVTIRGRNGRPFALWCAPLSETSPLSNGRSRTAVVVIVPDLAGERSDPKELTILFDLTPTEAKLALALTRGETLRIYAATNGVQFSTARTQLLSVLRKTGLRRQADLIRTLSSLASPLLQNNSDKSAAK
jgi:DNA-binding CsgD family transcriptional regulator